MKKVFLFVVLTLTVLSASFQTNAQNGVEVDNNGKALNAQEQKEFLAKRLPTGAITGTFGSYGSLLFAAQDVAIHSNNKEIGNIKLNSPFPSDYKPTWAELFDTIAVQTKTTWIYDSKRNYWLFLPFAQQQSYDLKIAEGWIPRNEGIYVGYKPPTYPVGMDIYQMGKYSADNPKEESAFFEKIRNTLALRFATGFKKDITIKEMQTVKIDGVDALFFESISPIRDYIMWRQWVLVKNGKAFVIVSSLNKEDKKLYEDVQSMVKSFQVK